MTFKRLGSKQLLAMTWWNRTGLRELDGIICDGAVRSGKTMALTCGFLLWSMASFDDQVFALCGKTVGALRRNVILPMSTWLGGMFRITENRSENKLTVCMGKRKNTYYLFGGQDEGSYMLIQGITLAGVLLDETVLMPRSFVEQAAARCSVEGAKIWFSCNPGAKEHWFYRDWVCKARQKRLLRLHFAMEDNPALTEAVRSRYERLYTGVFYRRYVLGQWCAAEGRIYDFEEGRHVLPKEKVDAWVGGAVSGPMWSSAPTGDRPTKNDKSAYHSERSEESPSMVRKSLRWGSFDSPSTTLRVAQDDRCRGAQDDRCRGAQDDRCEGKWYISVDYGTRNPFSAGLWCVSGGVAVRVREYYHDGRSSGVMKTDEEYYEALERLAGEHRIGRIIIDPSAASLIALIRRRGRFRVRRADNRVLPGIRLVGSLLQQGRLLVSPECKAAIREFGLYCWEDDDTKDVPKKENDHAMDDIRYFCMSVMGRN